MEFLLAIKGKTLKCKIRVLQTLKSKGEGIK